MDKIVIMGHNDGFTVAIAHQIYPTTDEYNTKCVDSELTLQQAYDLALEKADELNLRIEIWHPDED